MSTQPNYYPQLFITSKSEALIRQIHSIFNENGIKSSICCDKRINPQHPNITYRVFIYGVKNLERFVEIIGFSNKKHQDKYNKWKKRMAVAGLSGQLA